MREQQGFDAELQAKLGHEREREFISTAYIDLTRHGNRFGGKMSIRFADGASQEFDDTQELTPEGRAASRKFGEDFYKEVTLVHPRGGDEKRHGQSGEDILKGSGKFGEARETPALSFSSDKKVKGSRRGKGIDYISAGMMEILGGAKKFINYILQGLVDKLSDEDQARFKTDAEFRAKLREQAQIAGLKEAMKNEEIVRRAAEGEAYELIHVVELSRRGVKPPAGKSKGASKAIPIVSSGMFAESLFKYALVIEDENTGKRKVGFNDVEEIGGFTSPATAFRIKLTRDNRKGDPRNLADFDKDTIVECEFTDSERAKLFQGKKLSLDWDKVRKLAEAAEMRLAKKNG